MFFRIRKLLWMMTMVHLQKDLPISNLSRKRYCVLSYIYYNITDNLSYTFISTNLF